MSDQAIILRTEGNREFAMKFVASVKLDPDHPIEIVVRRHRKKRSLDQNALYWSWLSIISRETGNDPDDLHEFFKRQFAEPRVVSMKGDDFAIYSTAKMNVGQMSEYLDRVFNFAAGEGIVLPQPEDRRAA